MKLPYSWRANLDLVHLAPGKVVVAVSPLAREQSPSPSLPCARSLAWPPCAPTCHFGCRAGCRDGCLDGSRAGCREGCTASWGVTFLLPRSLEATQGASFRPRSLEATRGAPVLPRSLEATREAPFVVRLLGLHRSSLPRARPQSRFLGPLGVRNWELRHGVKGETVRSK